MLLSSPVKTFLLTDLPASHALRMCIRTEGTLGEVWPKQVAPPQPHSGDEGGRRKGEGDRGKTPWAKRAGYELTERL